MTNYKKVREFVNRVQNLKTDAGLEPVSLDTQYQLIVEEFNEVSEEFENLQNGVGTHINLLKECIDLLYVTYGLLARFDVDVDAGFSAVHENNMSKFNGATFREDGKLVKPDNFVKMTTEDLVSTLYKEDTNNAC
jgi:predicted HAD superfamily Cof-like phosphohydrolase